MIHSKPKEIQRPRKVFTIVRHRQPNLCVYNFPSSRTKTWTSHQLEKLHGDLPIQNHEVPGSRLWHRYQILSVIDTDYHRDAVEL